ncbi:MAG: hypothetical protein ABII18_09470 [bacterium]
MRNVLISGMLPQPALVPVPTIESAMSVAPKYSEVVSQSAPQQPEGSVKHALFRAPKQAKPQLVPGRARLAQLVLGQHTHLHTPENLVFQKKRIQEDIIPRVSQLYEKLLAENDDANEDLIVHLEEQLIRLSHALTATQDIELLIFEQGHVALPDGRVGYLQQHNGMWIFDDPNQNDYSKKVGRYTFILPKKVKMEALTPFDDHLCAKAIIEGKTYTMLWFNHESSPELFIDGNGNFYTAIYDAEGHFIGLHLKEDIDGTKPYLHQTNTQTNDQFLVLQGRIYEANNSGGDYEKIKYSNQIAYFIPKINRIITEQGHTYILNPNQPVAVETIDEQVAIIHKGKITVGFYDKNLIFRQPIEVKGINQTWRFFPQTHSVETEDRLRIDLTSQAMMSDQKGRIVHVYSNDMVFMEGVTGCHFDPQAVLIPPGNSFSLPDTLQDEALVLMKDEKQTTHCHAFVINMKWLRGNNTSIGRVEYVVLGKYFYTVSFSSKGYYFKRVTKDFKHHFLDITAKQELSFYTVENDHIIRYVGLRPHYRPSYDTRRYSQFSPLAGCKVTFDSRSQKFIPQKTLKYKGEFWAHHKSFLHISASEAFGEYCIASHVRNGETFIRLFRFTQAGFEMVENGHFHDAYIYNIYVKDGRVWDLSIIRDKWQVECALDTTRNERMMPSHNLVFVQDDQGHLRPATLQEMVESLAALPHVPQDYLAGPGKPKNVDFVTPQTLKKAKVVFLSENTVKKHSVSLFGREHVMINNDIVATEFTIFEFRVTEEEKEWRYHVLLPLYTDGEVGDISPYYIPRTNEDILALHRHIRTHLPDKDGRLIHNVQYVVGNKNASASYLSSEERLTIYGVRAKTREEWLKGITISTLTHEASGHGRERTNPYIYNLLMRAMILDSMTMTYGMTNQAEYYAVLSTYYFHMPHKLHFFPFGARVMHHIVRLTEDQGFIPGRFDSVKSHDISLIDLDFDERLELQMRLGDQVSFYNTDILLTCSADTLLDHQQLGFFCDPDGTDPVTPILMRIFPGMQLLMSLQKLSGLQAIHEPNGGFWTR